jgi:hypothetical protein
MDNVTKTDLKAFLKDMEVLTQKEFQDEEKRRIFAIWVNALDGVSLINFNRAKNKLVKEWKYKKFPLPADLLSRIEYHSKEFPVMEEFNEEKRKKAEPQRNAFFDMVHKMNKGECE